MYSENKKRKILYAISVIFFVISLVFIKLYKNEKKENNALKIKIATMSANKRTTKPWNEIIKINASKATSPKQSQPLVKAPETPSIKDQETFELAAFLQSKTKNISELDLETLEKNIEVANEVIAREPDTYSAYKAKLISLLVKEGKYNQILDETELQSLLETMAGFKIETDSMTRNEAILLAQTNNAIDAAYDKLNELISQEDKLTTPLEEEELMQKEESLLEEIDNLRASLSKEDNYVNEDVVEIPFLRMMAQNNLDGVIETANGFIEEFPNSLHGYYYLIKAMEMRGDNDEAVQALIQSPLSDTDKAKLQNRLENSTDEDFKTYWKKLIF